jgi:hypothetical protein
MKKFFAYLKKMFAVDKMYEVLASVVFDSINKTYIPALRKAMRNEKDPQRKGQIAELIEAYRQYADPHTAQGREFIDTTAKVVGQTALMFRSTVPNPEEVVQQIAGDFYANERMVRTMKGFDPIGGPLKLRNFWSEVLNKHSQWKFREEAKNLLRKKETAPSEDGEERDQFENMAAPERVEMREMIERMIEFFPKNVGRMTPKKYQAEVALEIFEIWSKELLRQGDFDLGPEEVKQKWEAMRRREGLAINRSGFYEGIKVIKDVLKEFFIEEKKYQRAAGKTAAERVAKAEFRVRFAKWILGE